MTRISDVMRTEFITVAPEDTLGEVAQRMVDLSVGSAIVKDFGRLIGIVSPRRHELLAGRADRTSS